MQTRVAEDGRVGAGGPGHDPPSRPPGQRKPGRVALCGDAAAGFLPTAGVGASAAIWSAAWLADLAAPA